MKNQMKKVILLLVMMVSVLCVNAQKKGDMAAGAHFVYGTSSDISNFGLGLKFQWNVTDVIRLEPSFNYFFPKDEGLGFKYNMTDFNANVHYLFPLKNEKFLFYPLAGLSYMNVSVKVLGVKASDGKFGFNIGGGGEYRLSDVLSLNLGIKYQIIADFNRPVFGLGVKYRF